MPSSIWTTPPAERDSMDHSITLPGARGRKLLALAMALSVTLAASGAAEAAYQFNNTTHIYACVNKLTKVARIVTPKNGVPACRSTEKVVGWMKYGAKGADRKSVV
jgi:hypothetical protein